MNKSKHYSEARENMRKQFLDCIGKNEKWTKSDKRKKILTFRNEKMEAQ